MISAGGHATCRLVLASNFLPGRLFDVSSSFVDHRSEHIVITRLYSNKRHRLNLRQLLSTRRTKGCLDASSLAASFARCHHAGSSLPTSIEMKVPELCLAVNTGLHLHRRWSSSLTTASPPSIVVPPPLMVLVNANGLFFAPTSAAALLHVDDSGLIPDIYYLAFNTAKELMHVDNTGSIPGIYYRSSSIAIANHLAVYVHHDLSQGRSLFFICTRSCSIFFLQPIRLLRQQRRATTASGCRSVHRLYTEAFFATPSDFSSHGT